MTIPQFLKPFAAELEKYKLETIKIETNLLSEGETLSIAQSKFLGQPYLPAGINYPVTSDGNPMIMLAQINFAEAPPLLGFPINGILQLFVHPDFYSQEFEYKILFHEVTNELCHTDFSFLTADFYGENCPIDREYKLTFKKEIDYGHVADFRFEMTFGAEINDTDAAMARLEHLKSMKIYCPKQYEKTTVFFEQTLEMYPQEARGIIEEDLAIRKAHVNYLKTLPREDYEALCKQYEDFQKEYGECCKALQSGYERFKGTLSKKKQKELENLFESENHKIGGYAYFSQDDPRDYDDDIKNDVLLLQICSEITKERNIMFGDCGVAHIFIHPDDLRNRNFSKAYFQWDCS